MSKPRPYISQKIGILNPYGDVWTDDVFDTPEAAHAHLMRFWKRNEARAAGFKIVPVTVTVEPIEVTDLTPRASK